MVTRNYFVYIKSNTALTRLEVGVVDNILSILLRTRERHKLATQANDDTNSEVCWKLVYYEHGHSLVTATTRCQKILKLPPSKKRILVERYNSTWRDLSIEWSF